MSQVVRFAAVALGTVILGTVLTALVFPILGAGHSSGGVAALAGVLASGNFVLLRQGARWAGRAAPAPRPLDARGVRSPAMAVHAAR